jgi:hypothetical protein
MKTIKTFLLLALTAIILLSFSLPEKADAQNYYGSLQISAEVKSSFKVGKALKLKVYVTDGTGQKVRDAIVNVFVSQASVNNQQIPLGGYSAVTNKKGRAKFSIYTKTMTPNVPCTINIKAYYGALPSGETNVIVYPTGKIKVPLQAHIVADVSKIIRPKSISLTAVGDNLVGNNYIYRTIWTRNCRYTVDDKNYTATKTWADVYSASTTWDSVVAPAGTWCVEFTVVIYDNLGRQTTASLILPYSDS